MPYMLGGFINAHAELVTMSGFTSVAAMSRLLGASCHLGRFSDVFLFADQSQWIRYIFHDPSCKPAGTLLPFRCPSCHRLRSFHSKGLRGDQWIYKCKGSDASNGKGSKVIKADSCGHSITVNEQPWMVSQNIACVGGRRGAEIWYRILNFEFNPH